MRKLIKENQKSWDKSPITTALMTPAAAAVSLERCVRTYLGFARDESTQKPQPSIVYAAYAPSPPRRHRGGRLLEIPSSCAFSAPVDDDVEVVSLQAESGDGWGAASKSRMSVVWLRHAHIHFSYKPGNVSDLSRAKHTSMSCVFVL